MSDNKQRETGLQIHILMLFQEMAEKLGELMPSEKSYDLAIEHLEVVNEAVREALSGLVEERDRAVEELAELEHEIEHHATSLDDRIFQMREEMREEIETNIWEFGVGDEVVQFQLAQALMDLTEQSGTPYADCDFDEAMHLAACLLNGDVVDNPHAQELLLQYALMASASEEAVEDEH